MKTIIFDVDGTLLSTESMYMQSLIQTFRDRGIEKSYEDVYKIFGLPSLDGLIKLGVENPKEMQLAWQSHYHDFWHEVKLFDGVTQMLSQLQSKGISLGIVTSNTPAEFKNHSKNFDFVKYFSDFVFAGDTPLMKPAADPILKSLMNLNTSADAAMYIGDSVHDMQAAHNAAVKFGMAAWGVRDESVFNNQADVIFRTPTELASYVLDQK